MESMDNIKGIAWVGNIYQKFETMCMEVEEAMCQETAKYVENQVQTVGASMKRFCSDVMQDLLPPSSKDLTRVASAELLLNPYLEFGIHKRSNETSKHQRIIAEPLSSMKGISEDKSKSSNDVWEDWSTASFDWDISDKDEANCDQMALNEAVTSKAKGEQELKLCNEIVNTSFGSPAPSTAVSTKPSSNVVKRTRRISTSNITRAERTDKSESRGSVSQMASQASINGDVSHIDPCENIRCVSSSQTDSHISSSTQYGESVIDKAFRSNTDPCENSRCVTSSQTDSHISSSTQSGESVIDEGVRSNTGSSADCAPNIIEDNDPSVQMMEPIGHVYEESGFEETCVLVDGSDYCLDNHNKEIKRSYKKKIKNAFSLKKKSARKQEYNQVAVQYDNAEQNIQSKTAVVPLSIATSENIKAKNLSSLDSLDSEWELL